MKVNHKSGAWQRIACALSLILLTLPLPLSAQEEAPLPWALTCELENQVSQDPANGCRMSQSLLAADSNTPVLVARVFVKPEPLLLLNLPLNVFLKPGLTMQIDGGRSNTYAFEICNEEGCHLGIPLDADLLNGLKRGNFARFTFRDGAGSEITVPTDLRGFTKNWDALTNAVQ